MIDIFIKQINYAPYFDYHWIILCSEVLCFENDGSVMRHSFSFYALYFKLYIDSRTLLVTFCGLFTSVFNNLILFTDDYSYFNSHCFQLNYHYNDNNSNFDNLSSLCYLIQIQQS